MFKRFRQLSGSATNQISRAEFNRALQTANIHLTDSDLKKLFRDLDSNGDGFIDMDEFSQLIIGRYGTMGAADNTGASIGSIGQRHEASDNWVAHATGSAEKLPHPELSAWIELPANLAYDKVIQDAMAPFSSYDGKDTKVCFRRKTGSDNLWAYVSFGSPGDMARAVQAGRCTVQDPEHANQQHSLKITAVAKAKGLGANSPRPADFQQKGGATGADGAQGTGARSLWVGGIPDSHAGSAALKTIFGTADSAQVRKKKGAANKKASWAIVTVCLAALVHAYLLPLHALYGYFSGLTRLVMWFGPVCRRRCSPGGS